MSLRIERGDDHIIREERTYYERPSAGNIITAIALGVITNVGAFFIFYNPFFALATALIFDAIIYESLLTSRRRTYYEDVERPPNSTHTTYVTQARPTASTVVLATQPPRPPVVLAQQPLPPQLLDDLSEQALRTMDLHILTEAQRAADAAKRAAIANAVRGQTEISAQRAAAAIAGRADELADARLQDEIAASCPAAVGAVMPAIGRNAQAAAAALYPQRAHLNQGDSARDSAARSATSRTAQAAAAGPATVSANRSPIGRTTQAAAALSPPRAPGLLGGMPRIWGTAAPPVAHRSFVGGRPQVAAAPPPPPVGRRSVVGKR